MSFVGMALSYLTALLFYAVMLAVIIMLRRVSKDITDFKQSIADLQQTLMIMQLPREKERDQAEHPE
jgi:hypothetical protein